MIGPRPTVGWIGYLLLGRSWFRFSLVLCLTAIIGIIFMAESRYTLDLTYHQPSRYPPPAIILATPDKDRLSPFDACGIEAATLHVEFPLFPEARERNTIWTREHEIYKELLNKMRNPMNQTEKFCKNCGHPEMDPETIDETIKHIQKQSEDISNQMSDLNLIHEGAEDDTDDADFGPDAQRFKIELEMEEESFKYDPFKRQRRRVFVYLWQKTVFRNDPWSHFVDKLPTVHLNYMDPTKSLVNTPLSSWKYRAGLSLQQPWISWLTAAMGLLWNFGGFVMPLGVILTKPIAVTHMGTGIGVLAADPNKDGMSPTILGTPEKHAVLEEIAIKLEDPLYQSYLPSERMPSYDSPLSSLEPLGPLLTDAVKDGCGVTFTDHLFLSDCSDFTLLLPEEVVSVDAKELSQKKFPSLKSLLFYRGDSTDLFDKVTLYKIFENLQLESFCPNVAGQVKRMTDPGIRSL